MTLISPSVKFEYLSLSSSSSCVDSTKSLDSLAISPYHPTPRPGSLDGIQRPNRAGVSLCWSANTGVSMSWNTLQKFVLSSLAVASHSCSSYIDGLGDGS